MSGMPPDAAPNHQRPRLPSSSIVVADAMREELLDPRLEADAFFGSEDQLVDRYGVSRPTLRQAVRILESEGLVCVKRGVGGGFFTRKPRTESVSHVASVYLRSQGTTIVEIMEASRLLSPLMARLAAGHPDEQLRTGPRRYVEEYQARDRTDEERWIFDAIAGFGRSLSALVTNQPLKLYGAILREVSGVPFHVRPFANAAHIEQTRQHHRDIADAVAAGDGETAERAMAEVMNMAMSWVQEAVQVNHTKPKREAKGRAR